MTAKALGSTDPLATVDEIEGAERVLLDDGRSIFGVSGRFEYGPLRAALRASGLGVYPVTALSLLAAVATLPLAALTLQLNDIETALGGYGKLLRLALSAAFLVSSGAACALADRARHRGRVAAGLALVSSVALIVAAFTTFWGLLLMLAVAGAATGFMQALVWPLLADSYPPAVRMRLFFSLSGGVIGALVTTALAIALAHGALELGWRGVFALLGGLGALAALAASRLANPARGRWDGDQLIRMVRDRAGGSGDAVADLGEGDVAVTNAERFRQVFATRSAKPLLSGVALVGLFAFAMQRYVFELWRAELHLTDATRWWCYVAVCVAGLGGLVLAARRAEVAYRAAPARVLQMLSWQATVGAAAVAGAAVSTNAVISVALWATAAAAFTPLAAGCAAALLSVTHPRLRAHAAVLAGLALLAGAQLGGNLLDTFGTRFGAAWGLITGAAFVLTVARQLAAAIPQIDDDLNQTVNTIVEDEKLRTMVSQGRHLPLLGCRHLDFSYGQLQVLFDVDFTVDDGEMVALLGTNGAGKSTLLRAISGVGLPSAGSVHYRGRDITYLGPDRRVALGISQVPGGRAVFGSMTVVENLHVYGFTLGRDKAAVASGIEATFATFPRLAERRNQTASTLSGGEQQMLALGKALVMRPRLLLIDELSLGLAPIVVSELLTMVRQINATGVSVVLVEQSATVALSLVHHAYFMEKGQVRFDGPAAQLLDRPDLLRSVFLEGVAAATKA